MHANSKSTAPPFRCFLPPVLELLAPKPGERVLHHKGRHTAGSRSKK